MKSNQWKDFISSEKALDLTKLLDFPHKYIKEECLPLLDDNTVLSFFETRSYKEAQKLHTKSAVIKKPEESGDYVQSKKWKAFSLFNYSGRSEDVIVSGFKNAYTNLEYRAIIKEFANHKWTERAIYFPVLKDYVDSVLQKYFYLGYIRLMILLPGGIIPPHCDHPIDYYSKSSFSVFNVMNSINISVVEADGHKFCLGDNLLPFKEGAVFWINTGIKHWVVNMSSKPRIHLLIHGLYKKDFRDKVFKYIKKKRNSIIKTFPPFSILNFDFYKNSSKKCF